MTHRTTALPLRSDLNNPLTLGFALLGLLFAATVGAATGPEKIRPSGEKIVVVPDRPGYSDVDIEVWTDRGDNGLYCVGEPISIYFRTTRDAWVAILDTDTTGHTHRLFPNRWDREHFAEAGRVYRLPIDGYRFEVEGPAGRETLYAVAALERRDLRRAVDDLLDPYAPARHDGSRSRGKRILSEKIAVVPDSHDVGFDAATHYVRDGYRCAPRRHHTRPWWRR